MLGLSLVFPSGNQVMFCKNYPLLADLPGVSCTANIALS